MIYMFRNNIKKGKVHKIMIYTFRILRKILYIKL